MNELNSFKNTIIPEEADRILAIASHDIKNPLHAIRLEAQMLIRIAQRNEKSSMSEEVKIQAQRILKTTDRLATLLTELIDRRRRQVKLNEFDDQVKLNLIQIIWDVVDTLRPLAREKKQKIILNTNYDKISFNGSYSKIFQLFVNLIGNSLKFSPAQSEVRIIVLHEGDLWNFTINDEGPGIPQDMIEELFEEFSVGKSAESGHGLGLFTCRNIVNEYGGTIKACNTYKGASFEVLLPVMTAELPCF